MNTNTGETEVVNPDGSTALFTAEPSCELLVEQFGLPEGAVTTWHPVEGIEYVTGFVTYSLPA